MGILVNSLWPARLHYVMQTVLLILTMAGNSLRPILVFYCCFNKLPQAYWLKTQLYHLTILLARSPTALSGLTFKINLLAGLVPLEAPGKNSVPFLFQLLEAACIPCLVFFLHRQNQWHSLWSFS